MATLARIFNRPLMFILNPITHRAFTAKIPLPQIFPNTLRIPNTLRTPNTPKIPRTNFIKGTTKISPSTLIIIMVGIEEAREVEAVVIEPQPPTDPIFNMIRVEKGLASTMEIFSFTIVIMDVKISCTLVTLSVLEGNL